MVSGSAALPEPVMKRWKEITGKYDPFEYHYFTITLKSNIPFLYLTKYIIPHVLWVEQGKMNSFLLRIKP